MTLQEAEAKLSDLNMQIDKLLLERETVLKEWSVAFHIENQDDIICVDENMGGSHKLYLVNGESKMYVCNLDDYDMESDIKDFYKHLDNSMHLLNITNKRDFDIPDYQKNLVYMKAIEIRDKFKNKV